MFGSGNFDLSDSYRSGSPTTLDMLKIYLFELKVKKKKPTLLSGAPNITSSHECYYKYQLTFCSSATIDGECDHTNEKKKRREKM